MIEVINPGLLLTVQDGGRSGWGHIGVPASGAADSGAMQAANAQLGNGPDYPVLEATLTGAELLFHEAAAVAIAGAGSDIEVNGGSVEFGSTLELGAGDALRIGPTVGGVRTYVAVRGGFAVPLTMGSASTDLLTGLGPPSLGVGDRLRFAQLPVRDGINEAIRPHQRRDVIAIAEGPHSELPDGIQGFEALLESSWSVSAQSNRVGVRLEPAADGGVIESTVAEMRSFGIPSGAIQLPPDGKPILMLADHPVTGGYPVIAVVDATYRSDVAQLRPGDEVRFSAVSFE